MIPLKIYGVIAPKVRFWRIAGGTAEGVLRPDTDEGPFFINYLLSGRRKQNERTVRATESTGACCFAGS